MHVLAKAVLQSLLHLGACQSPHFHLAQQRKSDEAVIANANLNLGRQPVGRIDIEQIHFDQILRANGKVRRLCEVALAQSA